MPTDLYVSAFGGDCETHIAIDYDERDDTVKQSAYRQLWCPSCGRAHNYRLLDGEEAAESRLGNADAEGGGSAGESQASLSDVTESGIASGDTSDDSSEAQPEPVTYDAEEDDVEEPPIDPSTLTNADLRDALSDDAHEWTTATLRGLYMAEVNGKARVGAIEAIEERLDESLVTIGEESGESPDA